MSSNRIDWIDIAKGLGIILVVLGHTSTPKDLAIIIYSFHMPLFFYLSGYLFSTNKYPTFKNFFNKKTKSILIPYFIFALISLLFYLIISKLASFKIDITHLIIGTFYSIGVDGWLDYNVALWFLTCLFIVEILFYFITKKITNLNLLLIILLLFSIIGYLDSLYMPIRLPWSIDIAFSAIVYFGLGYISRKKNIISLLLKHKYITFLISFLFFVFFTREMIVNGYMIDMNYLELNDYYNFYIPAISGVLIIIVFSSIITNKILIYLGRNSLTILVTHLPLIFVVNKLIKSVKILDNQMLICVLVSCVTIIITIPLIEFFNRYLPFVIGKGTVSKTKDKI